MPISLLVGLSFTINRWPCFVIGSYVLVFAVVMVKEVKEALKRDKVCFEHIDASKCNDIIFQLQYANIYAWWLVKMKVKNKNKYWKLTMREKDEQWFIEHFFFFFSCNFQYKLYWHGLVCRMSKWRSVKLTSQAGLRIFWEKLSLTHVLLIHFVGMS